VTREQILADMETIYHLALETGKLNVALHAKELQGKAIGLFNTPKSTPDIQISEMTEEQLTELIQRLEERDPSLKSKKKCYKDPQSDKVQNDDGQIETNAHKENIHCFNNEEFSHKEDHQGENSIDLPP
jgi:hypothetical protein